MVKKSSKLGVHSGNSLRASNSKYMRTYGKQACLVRNCNQASAFGAYGDTDANGEHIPVNRGQFRESFNLQEVVFDWDVSGNNVSFSLNKKGRWMLPTMIKDQIHSHEQREKDYRISLFEHHKLLKMADCVSYHTSKGSKKITQAKSGFFVKSSVDITPGRGRQQRRRVRPEHEVPVKVDVPKDPEIVYDVFYPSPITRSLTHNPKFVGKAGDSKCNGKAQPSTNRRVHKTTAEYLDIFDEETNGERFEAEENLSDAENTGDNFDDPNQTTSESPNYLDILLEKAINAKEMCDVEKTYIIPKIKSRNASSSDVSSKDNVVYVNENLPIEFYPNETKLNSINVVPKPLGQLNEETMEENITMETVPSARIFIPCSELTKDNLELNFPGRYFEGYCCPRKIAVDISEETSSVFRERGLLLDRQEVWSWLTLSQDGDQHEGLEVIRVCLNSELIFDQTHLDTLFEMNVYSLEEVCQSVRMFIESVSFNNTEALHRACCAKPQKPKLTFDTLRSEMKWSCDSYHGSQSHKIALKTQNYSVDDTMQLNNMPEFCNICFTSIDPSIHDNDPATSLRSCGHWFCENCWASHLLSKLNQGSLKLNCPEFDCDSEVDHVTCLTLMSASNFKKFLQHCHDNQVQQKSEEQKWCPNPKCGRVVTLQKDVVAEELGVCVSCECGHSFCFRCLGEAHWPATCQQANQHKIKMKQNGDQRMIDFSQLDTDFVVRVKLCPKCKEPINKNGGCPHVICRCSHGFCWSCGATWPHQNPCPSPYNSEKEGTKKHVIRNQDAMKHRPKLYQLSVKHHQFRHPKNINKFEKKAKSFAKLMKPWAFNHFKEVESVLGCYGAEENDRLSVCRSVDQFVYNISKLQTEVHFVIEYSALVLQDGVTSNYTRLVRQLIDRMEFFCFLTEQIFEGSKEKKVSIPDLQRLQNQMRNCLITLIKAAPEIESKNKSPV